MTTSDVIDDDLPRPFGAYLLLQNFARGGMGEVYLAKSGGIAGLERVCVLKKLRAELTGDREYVTRFVDEARVVVTLNHANICSVFDVGRVATPGPDGPVDEYYLAMEYIAGRDLRSMQDRCRRQAIVPEPTVVVHLICEVLKALDYAHRRKHPVTGEPLHLVHRDISPQNVLVSYEGEVKLIDFGLAASRLKVERTQPNVVMGKMAYMPPEQARGDAIDSRADLFACGVMLYELLANERYYEGMTANDIWQVAGRGSFMPRSWARLDPGLQGILARALHPDPQRRLATCGEFRELLLGWAAARGAAGAERSLRELMEHLFVDEMARERATMARFGGVTIASFRGEIESTKNHVVSLAGERSAAKAEPPRGIHEEPTLFDARRPARSTEEGRSTPSSEGTPRIHEERTMVTSPSGRTLRALEQEAAAGRVERTQIVRRRHDTEEDDTDGVPGDATAIDLPARRGLWVGGAVGVAALLIGLGLAAGRWRDAPPAPTTPPTTTTTTTTPPPTPTPTPTTPPPTMPPSTTTRPAPPRLAPPPTTTKAPVRPPPPTASPPTAPPKPKPPPTTLPAAAPVPATGWEALVRARPPCLAPLLAARGRFPESVFLSGHAAEIRACAAQAGVVIR